MCVSVCLSLIVCFNASVMLARNGNNIFQRLLRAFVIHSMAVISKVSKHDALHPQKPQGLLGTGRRGEGGMEMGEEGEYIPIATLSPSE